MKKRKIAVIVGSLNDLISQGGKGLRALQKYAAGGVIEVIGVYVSSIHRNTEATLALLKDLSAREVDVIITGAGWANHLTGTADAYLRHEIRNTHTVVVGVAFADEKDPKRTEAAVASIVYVPGTQVVWSLCVMTGSEGFRRACEWAATEDLPEIKLPTPHEPRAMTLGEAVQEVAATERAEEIIRPPTA